MSVASCTDPRIRFDASIGELNAEIAARLVPFDAAVRIITSIPGISQTTAEVIVAETGADMTRFPTAGRETEAPTSCAQNPP